MNETLLPLLKLSLVVFMAGNLLGMGLSLDYRDALVGLRNLRFAGLTLVWGFVVGPALAWLITRVLPMDPHQATGLRLMGMTPCAPFVPMIVARANGDLGSTAAFMLLAAAATVAFMPFAVPLMVKGLTVNAWTVAKPLLVVIALPLALGMVILRTSAAFAARMQPGVRKTTVLAMIVLLSLCVVIYGKGLIGITTTLAIPALLVFFAVMMTFPYWFGFGLPHEQKIVLSVGMATRNIGAAWAPLLSIPDVDEPAVVMLVLGFFVMFGFAILATKWFRPAGAGR